MSFETGIGYVTGISPLYVRSIVVIIFRSQPAHFHCSVLLALILLFSSSIFFLYSSWTWGYTDFKTHGLYKSFDTITDSVTQGDKKFIIWVTEEGEMGKCFLFRISDVDQYCRQSSGPGDTPHIIKTITKINVDKLDYWYLTFLFNTDKFILDFPVEYVRFILNSPFQWIRFIASPCYCYIGIISVNISPPIPCVHHYTSSV